MKDCFKEGCYGIEVDDYVFPVSLFQGGWLCLPIEYV